MRIGHCLGVVRYSTGGIWQVRETALRGLCAGGHPGIESLRSPSPKKYDERFACRKQYKIICTLVHTVVAAVFVRVKSSEVCAVLRGLCVYYCSNCLLALSGGMCSGLRRPPLLLPLSRTTSLRKREVSRPPPPKRTRQPTTL